MHKTHIEYKYINTVLENENFFNSYYYHAILDLNLIKLDSILNNGIMSKRLIENNGLINIYTHEGDSPNSKNGNDYISLSKFPEDIEFNNHYESFSMHTLSSPSIMLSKDIELSNGERKRIFDDEIFVKDYIPVEKFKGILLPQHLTTKYISEINILTNDLSCYTNSYINNLILKLETYFKQNIDRNKIFNSLEEFISICSKYENLDIWITAILNEQRKRYGHDIADTIAIELHNLWSNKTNINNPTYIDIIAYLNKDRLPIYEIKEKSLIKRLN